MRRIIYRDYRQGKHGQFVSEATYNRSRGQGATCHIHREYVNTDVISSIDDLFDIQDDEDLEDYEFHGTGKTGRASE